jgi:hypothetical protein
MNCSGGACRYPLPSPGAPGWSCTKDTDCEAGGACIEDPQSKARVCSIRCDPAQPTCPSGFACESTSAADFYCLASPAAPAGSAGCTTAPRAPVDVIPTLSVAILAGLLARQRHRQARLSRRRAGYRD